MDWDFWETPDDWEEGDESDILITVYYYNENATIGDDKPLSRWSIWQSELIALRQTARSDEA